MPERISDVIREESGNAGAIRVLNALSSLASVTANTATDSTVKSAASMASEALIFIAKALAGQFNADNIKLDDLFVKSPTELLKERGITEGDIERILSEGR